jgi:hypothetical protein
MTESQQTRKLCAALEAAGATVIALVGGLMQQGGLPDRYVASLRPCWSGWLEAKRGDGVVTLRQRIVHESLITRGVPVVIVRYLPNDQVRLTCSLGRSGEWGEGDCSIKGGMKCLLEMADLTRLAREEGVWPDEDHRAIS